MRFPFKELPAAGGGTLTPRPIVDLWVEGIDVAPLGCLIDTGALRTRFTRELADLAGIEPDESQTEEFALGGNVTRGAPARVSLRMESGAEEHWWDAPVWFCEPWPFGFQLLGLDGFLRHFRVTISAYHEWLDCESESP